MTSQTYFLRPAGVKKRNHYRQREKVTLAKVIWLTMRLINLSCRVAAPRT
jgi:hypothetical protein